MGKGRPIAVSTPPKNIERARQRAQLQRQGIGAVATGRVVVRGNHDRPGRPTGAGLETSRSTGDAEHGGTTNLKDSKTFEPHDGKGIQRTLDQPAAGTLPARRGHEHTAAAVGPGTENRGTLAGMREHKAACTRIKSLELYGTRIGLRGTGVAVDQRADGAGRQERTAVDRARASGIDPAHGGRQNAVARDDAAGDEVLVAGTRRHNRLRGGPHATRTRVVGGLEDRMNPRSDSRRVLSGVDHRRQVQAEIGPDQARTATPATGEDLGTFSGTEPAGVLAVTADGARTMPFRAGTTPTSARRQRCTHNRP